jgi:diguanylate cyclase (GGDEF)-like protein
VSSAQAQKTRALEPSVPLPLGVADDRGARRAARRRAFELIRDVQTGVPLAAAVVERMIEDADARGWPEVARAALFLQVVRSFIELGRPDPALVTRMLERGEADGEPAMSALALAMRAEFVSASANPFSTAAADHDLARASVMLEIDGGDPLERACAHMACARAYEERDLWELDLQHYAAAKTVAQEHPDGDLVLPAILYNLAELQLRWSAALRELGDSGALSYRARQARQALAAADNPEMHDTWRAELRIYAALLSALAPGIGAPAPECAPEGRYAGHVHLTRALRLKDPVQAVAEAERALAMIDPENSSHIYNLALSVAAELEAAVAGAETAGRRYAKHVTRQRWATRLSSLASMQSMLHAERLRAEHDVLSRHAYLDDLTHLGNRRALVRYVEGLVSRGVTAVALVLIDLDHFKEINDSYGHGVGDQALTRVAGVLRGAVRSADLSVRLGGDEFLLALASADRDAARSRADAILAALATEDWSELAEGMRVTVSVGLASGDPKSFEELRIAADDALYRAKTGGRNRVSE